MLFGVSLQLEVGQRLRVLLRRCRLFGFQMHTSGILERNILMWCLCVLGSAGVVPSVDQMSELEEHYPKFCEWLIAQYREYIPSQITANTMKRRTLDGNVLAFIITQLFDEEFRFMFVGDEKDVYEGSKLLEPSRWSVTFI